MKTVITLLSDFGLIDPFVGIMKGVILSLNRLVEIVDLCHQVPAHDVTQAAYQWRASFRYFPPGTVQVGVVDPGVGSDRKGILAVSKEFFYIAPDNGLLTLIEREDPFKAIYELANPDLRLSMISNTFHGRDIFAPAAAHVTLGVPPSDFGPPLEEIKQLDLPAPKVTDGCIEGRIVGADQFGNLFTNLDGALFLEHFPEKEFVLTLRGNTVTRFRECYASREKAEAFILINSREQLEIAYTNDRADRRLGAGVGETFLIKPSFPENDDRY